MIVFCFRLMVLTTKYNILYIPTCLAILYFLLNYITSRRTNFLLSFVILGLLFSESLFFESIFLVISMFITFFLLTFQYLLKRNELIFSAFSIFIQINCFLFAQLYGFKNLSDSCKNFDDWVLFKTNLDIFGIMTDIIHLGGSNYNEIFLISKVYDYVNVLLCDNCR